MKTFEELYCYQKAVEIRRKISGLVKTFPTEEKYRLVDQLIRSSRSAPSQIAEGYGRFHYQENIQFCRQGRGSLYELVDHLIVAKEENYLSADKFEELKAEVLECITVLNGYINYLVKAKANSGRVEEPASTYGEATIND